MRYMLLSYYQKPNGQIDEAMSLSKNLKARDLQMASVILDFKKLQVVKATLNGVLVPKDFDRIVQYYYQHYENVIQRLFRENGYEVSTEKPTEANEQNTSK